MPDLIGHLPFINAFEKWRVSTRHFFEWRFPLGGGNDIFARVAPKFILT